MNTVRQAVSFARGTVSLQSEEYALPEEVRSCIVLVRECFACVKFLLRRRIFSVQAALCCSAFSARNAVEAAACGGDRGVEHVRSVLGGG